MLSQRLMQQSSRRYLTIKPSSLLYSPRVFAPPFASQIRKASIAHQDAEKVSQPDSMQILVNQRLNRPVSPHLTIYKPQITWIPSAFHRITGCILSGGLYIFGALYVAAPLVGWQITSAGMAASFAKWPIIAQVLTKMSLALPFTFHSLNGLRHLMWDTGAGISNPMVIKTGWTVVGLSVLSTLGLALFL